jgi:glycosyltransferase involved in cell wall biosynthesis
VKVLLQNRLDSDRYPGGDTIQIRKTAEFLSSHGIETRICPEISTDLQEFDLVFIFNLTNLFECFLGSLNAIRQKKPYLVFPIYWDLETAIPRNAFVGLKRYFMERLPPRLRDVIRRAYALMRYLNKTERKRDLLHLLLNESDGLKGEVLIHSSHILPNSEAECRLLMNCFPEIPASKYTVVRSGCGRIEKSPPPENWPEQVNGQPFVCCIGAIGPRKNQLNLVRALRGLPIPVILVGPVKRENKGYYDLLVREKRENIFFLGPQPPESVSWILKRTAVHVQPSYIETPGLASLEAGLYGCNVVATDMPPVREYFGGRIFYCDPNDVESIRKAVELALIAKVPNKALSRFVETEYSWDRTLCPLIEIMEKVNSVGTTARHP